MPFALPGGTSGAAEPDAAAELGAAELEPAADELDPAAGLDAGAEPPPAADDEGGAADEFAAGEAVVLLQAASTIDTHATPTRPDANHFLFMSVAVLSLVHRPL